MNIKKLELQGFKSFPERTKLIFHEGITAVIGPNGTGKSNIVDALLWVLGGKRMKGLRGERSGDIIFNGSAKVAPMGMADVTLILGDGDEELNVNHRVFRSKESEYRMSGKQVRLKDIQETLYKKAIGDSQYFVIEQGNIGVFLSSKPIEKRALLEEAAGTAYYKDKKRQAELKLENTEQNLTRLEDIIEEVSKAKNSLKRQANSAIRYRELREKIRELTLLYYRGKIKSAEKKQQQTLLTYQRNTDREKNALHALKEKEKILAEKRKELWELEYSNKKDQEILFTQKNRLSQSETEKERETKRIELIEENKKRDIQIKKELKQELISLAKDKDKSRQIIKKLNTSLEESRKDLKSFDRTGQSLQEKIGARKKEIDRLRGEALVNLSELTEFRNERAKFEKELELFLRQEEKLKSDLDSEQAQLNKIEDKIQRINEESNQEKANLKEKQKGLETEKKAVKGLTDSLDKLRAEQTDLEKQKEKDKHHLHTLEQLLKNEKKTWRPTEIPGSLGLLADLIESDAEYTPAVDVFWREEARAQIVPPKNLMDELNKGNIEGNFLLLSDQKNEDFSKEVFQDSRVLGRIKAKIKPNRRIKDHLSPLKDAAIVEDVRDAVELWLRNPSMNFITVSGDVLHSSGLLNLGEKKEGLFALNQEIKSLRDRIKQLERQISPLTQAIEERQEEEHKLREHIERAEKSLVQIESQISAKDKEKDFAQTEKERTETNIILLNKEIDLLAEDKKAATERLSSVSAKVQTLEDKNTDFVRKIEGEERTITQLQKKAAQEKDSFFELKSQIDILQEKISSAEERIQTIGQRTNIIQSKTVSLDKEILDSDRQKTTIQATISGITDRAAKLEADIKEKEKSLIANENRLKEIQEEQRELEKQLDREKENFENNKDLRVRSEIEKAEVERDLVNLEESCWQDLRKTLQEVKEEITGDIIPDENIEEELEKAKEGLQKIGNVNLMAEEEYTIQQKRYDFLVQERQDLRESITSTKEAISKIDKESKNQFLIALESVNNSFRDVFSLLFEGGNAEVKLADPNNPLESGIEIVAQPPGKRLQSLNLLSGGEKSLTSLAFFFGLFRYKPTPFCILDEVDAALDDANLGRFLNLMKIIKSQTQFIIITHNSKTMEVADYIYGTTMAEPNITSIFSVKIEKSNQGQK